MKKLTNYFLKGLLVFVPVAVTLAVIIWAFTLLDSFFKKIFGITTPGLGFIMTLVIITLLGFLASNFIGKKLFEFVDRIFTRLPFIKLFYSATKDVIEAITGEKKSFDKPALVELTPDGPKALGFITRQSLESLGLSDHVAVYFPQSYNFAGSVLFFPADRVKPIDIESSEAMTFIVSGGVSGK